MRVGELKSDSETRSRLKPYYKVERKRTECGA